MERKTKVGRKGLPVITGSGFGEKPEGTNDYINALFGSATWQQY